MEKFLLGAATAPHQVEGNNTNSDCWAEEHLPFTPYAESSGIACDHYNRYEEDIALLANAGLNAYRFGIEWARVQPRWGAFDKKEIAHYRAVLECCIKNKVTPVVTMHHFSSPKWLISLGGWESEETIPLFAEYCGRMAKELGDLLEKGYVCTVNEANMGLQYARMVQNLMKKMSAGIQVGVNLGGGAERFQKYALAQAEAFGVQSGQVNTFLSARTAKGDEIVMRAHAAARDAMKKLCPQLKIGVTFSLHDIQAQAGGESLAREIWNEEFTHYLPYIQGDDFLGVQNYTRKVIGAEGELLPAPSARLTQMGYEDYPQALANVVRRVAEDYKGDILVTENGLSTDDDARRIEFIGEATDVLVQAKRSGIPVKGYLYWTLLDNFEWQKAYGPKFGLVAVDRATMERKPKGSLGYLGSLYGKFEGE